jgi:transcription initiation factor TFIIIB Brf1 subunit/transcription initiation factor TFIIB
MDSEIFPSKQVYDRFVNITQAACEPEEECKHENTIEGDGTRVCEDCGLEQEMITHVAEWRYYDTGAKGTKDPSRCHKMKTNAKTIDSVVEKLQLPDSIKHVAEQKYRQVVGIKTSRGTGRKGIVAACLLHAYRSIGDWRTQDEVRKMFDLTKKEMSAGLTKYYEKFPDDRVQTVKPEHLIKRILTQTDIHISHYRGILGLTKYLDHTSSLIQRSNSQSTSAAIVYLYMCMHPDYKNELGLTKSSFAKKVGLSDITICKLAKEALKIALGDENIKL